MVPRPVTASQIFPGQAYRRAGRGLPDHRRELRHPGDHLAAASRIRRWHPDHGGQSGQIFSAAFPPLVSLAVAIILFDGGLDLVTTGLEGDSRRVVHELRAMLGRCARGLC